MAAVPQKTLSWLYGVLGREYKDPNRTYSDIAQLLSHYPTFALRTDVYTHENGISVLLIQLEGTILASFRTQIYRFPIAIWIPHAYPYEAPSVYVKPTKDMVVRPGQHVDGSGKVYHHYLAQWRDHWDRSTILEFLTMLSGVFAREPPVISKEQISTTDLSQQQPPGVPPAVHPSPGDLQRLSPTTLISGYGQPVAPPPPPKEPATISNLTRYSPDSPIASRYDTPPPLPAKTDGSGSLQHVYSYESNGTMSSAPQPGQYVPQRNTNLRQSGILQPQPHPEPGLYHQQHLGSRSVRQVHGNLPALPNPSSSQPVLASHAQRLLSQRIATGTYQQQMPPQFPSQSRPIPHYQAPEQSAFYRHHQKPPKQPPAVNLLDSPFDITLPTAHNVPAPPIPRNPEKEALLSSLSQTLTQTLHNSIAQNNSALPALQAQYSALAFTYQKIESEIQNLSSLNSSLQSNNRVLQSSLGNADKTIANAQQRAQRGDGPKVDEMLTAPTVVGKQLYDIVCEERGIEAAIWALQEGFVRGRIGTDIWAKKTRELAREGFRKRVLAQKIGEGMGLDGASKQL